MSSFRKPVTAVASSGLAGTLVNDVELVDPPTDSISSLSFSGLGDYLAVGSWDNSVSLYEVSTERQSVKKAAFLHQAPVLSVCWDKDGRNVLSGGADHAAQIFDIQTGQARQVAQHDAPIKVVKWVDMPGAGLLATGSWDKTIKYWDLRSAIPAAAVQLPERCYAMDVNYPWVVVGTADRHVLIFNLNNPSTAFRTITSPLRMQTRVISFNKTSDRNSFAIGSIEGRLAIHHPEERFSSKNFSFRCHRQDSSLNAKDGALTYPVNDVAFHPVHGTFVTCGGDGVLAFWDGEARVRMRFYDPLPAPIAAATFNKTGTTCAVAVSYDWHRGHSGMTPGMPVKVKLHACKEDEILRRNKNNPTR